MTVGDVIADVREFNKGKYTDSNIVRWLTELDERIMNDIILTHYWAKDIIDEHFDEDRKFIEYNVDDLDKELIVPNMYASLYRHYIDSQIYMVNGEMNKYNNASSMYNNTYNEYENWYNRTHEHLPTNIKIRNRFHYIFNPLDM